LSAIDIAQTLFGVGRGSPKPTRILYLTAGPRYIRGCCLMLERRCGFRAGA